MNKVFSFVLGICLLTTSAFALNVNSKSKFDKRVTYAKYNAEDVFKIVAKVGYVSMIELAPDERVQLMHIGFSNGWEVIDSRNLIFVKPMVYQANTAEQGQIKNADGQPAGIPLMVQPNSKDWKTNLIVITNYRKYVFDLELEEDMEKTFNSDYSLSFSYPEAKVAAKVKDIALNKNKNNAEIEEAKLRAQALAEMEAEEKKEKERKEKIKNYLDATSIPKNWDYVMHINKHSDVISPDFVYDDGLFTYIGFKRAKSIPSFFEYYEEDGKPVESMVSKHLKQYDKYNVMVVHKTFDRLILRSGNRLVAIKNNGYGLNEVDDLRTTKSKHVIRKIKESNIQNNDTNMSQQKGAN